MFNKVIAAGYLGADPESRMTTNGKAVVNFRVGVTIGKDDRTEWFSCVAWEKTAELVTEYLRKGSPVLIEGRLQTRKWQDKQGSDRYTTEVVADRVVFLPNKDRDEETPAKPRRRAPELESANTEYDEDDAPFDDNIPF